MLLRKENEMHGVLFGSFFVRRGELSPGCRSQVPTAHGRQRQWQEYLLLSKEKLSCL